MAGSERLLVLFSTQDARKKSVFVHVCGDGHCGNVLERMIGDRGVHRDHGGNMRKSVSFFLSLSVGGHWVWTPH